MRIAVILPGLGRVQRGAESAFLELSRHLALSPGVHVELFGSGDQGVGDLPIHAIPCAPRERFEGWPRLPAFRTECHYEEFSFARRLARSGLFRPEAFDVVLSCTYPHINWYLQRVGRGSAFRSVFVTQNGDWMCRADSREFRFFRCDGLVCINPDYFLRHRGRYPSVLIPNGVDAKQFHPRSNSEGWPGGGRVVLMVSALIASKRVADGIRAVARVPGASLLLAGDGPDRARIADLAGELLPGRHELLGNVPRQRMPDLYHRADAFLHMSQDEPFGIVHLEAAASGLPQVAHDGPVPRWILGPTGLYADTSDPVAVAQALAQSLDPDVGPGLGAAARRRVAQGWTWREHAANYLAFFETLLTTPRDPARTRGISPHDLPRHRQLQHSRTAGPVPPVDLGV